MRFPWPRFWCREGGARQAAFSDYFSLPYGYQKGDQIDVATFGALQRQPCLILLGEPGMGKTIAVSQAVADLQGADSAADEGRRRVVVLLKLGSYGSEDRLLRDLFENETYRSWENGQGELHLFLDALDECLLRLEHVAQLLGDELEQRLPARCEQLQRFFLRISCRTAVWPRTLEERLKYLWEHREDHPRVGVYELAPLRREDVVQGAEMSGLDAVRFMEEVARRQVEPLVAKPVTLRLLLNLFQAGGSLPETEAEIYRQGCLLLCQEDNDLYRRKHGASALDAERRLVVAARIAALTVFSNRESIWMGVEDGRLTEADVPLRLLAGGAETTTLENGAPATVEVTMQAVEETITSTGLFSSGGAHRMGWAHRTHAEFLAAHYLALCETPARQASQLLAHPLDPQKKLVPQLHEAASRFASLQTPASHEFFKDILNSEPLVLLQSDIAAATPEHRLALTHSLLQACDSGLLSFLPLTRLHTLRCEPLEEMLRIWILDDAKSEDARDAAIDIALSCRLSGLAEECLAVALDKQLPLRLRRTAIAAVGQLGSPDDRTRLRLLAEAEDEDEEIRGAALGCLWPGVLTAKELFGLLFSERKESLSGTYMHFLSSELAPHLNVADLPTALEWVREQGRRGDLEFGAADLADEIVSLAWEHLDDENVRLALAQLVWQRVRAHDDLTNPNDYECILGQKPRSGDLLRGDDRRRRELLLALAPLVGEDSILPEPRPYLSIPIALPSDVPWLLAQLEREVIPSRRRVWTQLVTYLVGALSDLEQLPLVLEACSSQPELAEAFAWAWHPIHLDSPQAAELRAQQERRERHTHPEKPPAPSLDPPPSERVRRLLEEFEAGDLDAWWKLVCYELTLEPHDKYFYSDRQVDPNIQRAVGWLAADEATCERIVSAALVYARDAMGEPERCFEKGSSYSPYWPNTAGYKALRLLSNLHPSSLKELPPSTWQRWTPIIMRLTSLHFHGGGKEPNNLLLLAYNRAPEAFIAFLRRRIDSENYREGYFHLLSDVEDCWDERLQQVLLEEARNPALFPLLATNILAALLRHAAPGAKELGLFWVEARAADEDAEQRAVLAAAHLLHHTADASWSNLWPFFSQDPHFGRQVVESISRDDSRSEEMQQRLSPAQLGDFYLWLSEQYPHAEDPKREGWGEIEEREMIARFRETVASHLARRGTFEALAQVERLCEALPDVSGLRESRRHAGDLARRSTWTPPSPAAVLRLCQDASSRLVESEEQLLEVVLESLRRFETKCHDALPLTPSLWNDWAKEPPAGAPRKRGRPTKVYRPKDENHLSSVIASHLNEDLRRVGAIVNREVEIRPGEFTDLHIDAVPIGSRSSLFEGQDPQRLSVIVEVKGCWHSELATAMRTQLVNRYMRQNSCRHGIYLVGWFHCDKWDAADPDRGKGLRFAPTLEEAQSKLDEQTASLSRADLAVRAVVLDLRLR